MVRKLRLAFFTVCAVAGLAAGLVATAVRADAPAASAGDVYVVPIHGVVDEGMAHLVQRAVDEANTAHASAVVLDVNTPGGLLDAAFEIRDAMFSAHVPTIAYVSERAYSAGALITLSAQKIVMAPGSSIGAAEPIPNDPKHVSAVRAEFGSTAVRNHRDKTLAEAMVDKNVAAPSYKQAGAILTLTADDAERAHIADALAPTLDDALRDESVHGALHPESYSWGELLARFATNPDVSGVLLSIGVLGLLIEMQTLHGIAGFIGVGALTLFFGTHVYEGFSDAFVIVLAFAGVLGILFELHVLPGHGVAGALGAIALLAAIVLAFGWFVFITVQAISIAIVLSAIVFFLFTRVFPENAFVRHFGFSAVQGADYVTSSNFQDLIGRTGRATSYLRPAGVMNVDGRRVDVLTEGDFVPAGSPVKVTRVEGARIFVAPFVEEK